MTAYPFSFLHGFRLKCLEADLHVHSIIVDSNRFGKTTHDFKPQRRQNIYSGSKTVTALAVGMAIQEGRVQLATKLLDVFPEYGEQAAEHVDAITLRHLLNMTAGKHHFFLKAAQPNDDVDILELFCQEPLDALPGETFFYNNASTYALSRIVEAVSGERLDQYLMKRLFAPLGIVRPAWHTCARNHVFGFSELYLTPDEYSRIGRLLLNGGVYEDKERVAASYIEQMHTDTIDSGFFDEPELEAGYGYQCWRGTIPGSFRADGLYGQFSVVSPRHEAVVTATAHNVDNPYGIIAAMNTEIFDLLDQLEV